MELITTIIKPVLLILIPFTWVIGMWLKKALTYQNDNRLIKWIVTRLIKDTGRIRAILYVLITAIAILIGFIFSDLEGLRKVGEAVVIYGLNGVVCAWAATFLYDKVRAQ